MRSHLALLGIVAWVFAACGGDSGPIAQSGAIGSTFTTSGGFTSGTFGGTTAGRTTSGDGTLDGDLAFPVANAWATNTGLSTMSVAMSDGFSNGCGAADAARTLRIDFALDQGATPGRYDLDGGVAVTLLDQTTSPAEQVATGRDGTVYLFEVDDGAVRGNLDVTLVDDDGGATSALHGNFNAAPCN